MEGIKKELWPIEKWASPAVFPSHSGSQEKIMISTPNLSVWPSLEDSEGNRQDSGYSSFTPSSFTPSSAGSFGQIFGKSCLRCNKLTNNNYEQSTPENMLCDCEKKRFFDSQSPSHVKYLQMTSESNSTKIRSRFRPTRALDLYDTSLYTEDMDIECESDEHQCVVGQLEIGDEKSIDFLDSNISLSSSEPDESTRFKKSEENSDNDVKSSDVDTINIFSPKQDVFHFKAGSPKAHNDTSLTETKSISTFQTASTKVILMKRVLRTLLSGIEKVDILYQLVLNKIHCPDIVGEIFSYLAESDLNNVRLVSKTWKNILDENKGTHKRWTSYKTARLRRKENLMSPTKQGTSGGRQRSLQPLSQLHNICNVYNNPPATSSPRFSPPVSPDSARFRSFQRAAKSLKNGERLLQCPRCFFPSHDRGNPTVQCSRSGCRHRFCVWCRNEIFSDRNHNCPPAYIPPLLNTPVARRSSYKLQTVGSKGCKRQLRRL